MWVYRSGEFTRNPVVIYGYQPSRVGACVREILTGYSGYLLSDGYIAYDTLEDVIQAAYMAHARRKFTDTQKASPSKKTAKPEKVLNCIAKLYGIEKQAKGLSVSERKTLRKQEAEPILSEFKEWLDAQNVLPKGLLSKAITYTQNQWPKNWIFSTSIGGAKASANLYSLMMTCRANDINPYYYFQNLFT